MTQLQKDQNESTENMKVDLKRNLVDRWGQIVFGLFLILLFVILYVIARECKFDQDRYEMIGPIVLILLVGAVVFVLANLFKPMMTKEDKETSEKNNRKPCDNDDKLQVLLCQYSEAFTCEREYNKLIFQTLSLFHGFSTFLIYFAISIRELYVSLLILLMALLFTFTLTVSVHKHHFFRLVKLRELESLENELVTQFDARHICPKKTEDIMEDVEKGLMKGIPTGFPYRQSAMNWLLKSMWIMQILIILLMILLVTGII